MPEQVSLRRLTPDQLAAICDCAVPLTSELSEQCLVALGMRANELRELGLSPKDIRTPWQTHHRRLLRKHFNQRPAQNAYAVLQVSLARIRHRQQCKGVTCQ
jgi:hypothetical protein